MESKYAEPVTQGTLFFRPPSIDDLDTIHAIEAASYPDDEAATYKKLKFRIDHAPGLFLVAESSGGGGGGGGGDAPGGAPADEIVGYVCGTCSSSDSLTHESMGRHDPDGRLLCIHSVCVDERHRRRGVATRLLRAYLRYVSATTPLLEEARLICKEHTVPLYAGVGFRLLGPSPVVHGQEQWLEMAHGLDGGDGDGAAG